MLQTRVLVSLAILPIGLAVILLGGLPLALFIILVMGVTVWEFARLFRSAGVKPAEVLMIVAVVALIAGRAWDGFASGPWILSLATLASMVYFTVQYECGDDRAATGFAVTLAGILYCGWIGGYFISLRALPEGQWWMLTALPSVWIADSFAYLVGKRFGRHPLTRRVSPKKTWEGYWAGVVGGTLGGFLLPFVWSIWAGPYTAITPLRGALLGLVLSVLTTLGDLGESMIKRQVGAKDSGTLLPGHGGVFDRVDSWLWAAVIGYYMVSTFFL